MIKDLKLLAPFSTFSNLCTFVGLILTFYYLIEDELIVDEDKFKSQGLAEIPVFIGITLFAMEAVGVVREYAGEGGSCAPTPANVYLVCAGTGARVQHGEAQGVHRGFRTL